MAPNPSAAGAVPDPWAHRSEGLRCKSCMWFVPKQAGDAITDLGRCRRRSPTANGFPPVFVNDWCGDHRLDESWVAEQRDQSKHYMDMGRFFRGLGREPGAQHPGQPMNEAGE